MLAATVVTWASATSAAPGTTEGTVAGGPPPAAMVAALLTAEQLGVPTDWVVRDADQSLLADDSVPADDLDPFQGLLTCPDDVSGAVPDGVWIARRYSAPEVPLENGLLSVDIIVQEESSASTDRPALDECTVGDQDHLSVGATTLDVDAGPDIDAVTLELFGSPSANVAYPSVHDAVVASGGGYTVTVVLGGVDMGASWQALAGDIASASLGQLTAATVASSSPSASAPAAAPPST